MLSFLGKKEDRLGIVVVSLRVFGGFVFLVASCVFLLG